MKKRNASIEFYRCLLMFGICFLHSVTVGGYSNRYVVNCFMPCVTAFVFITGYFGADFSVQRILRLYGIGAYAATTVFVCAFCLDLPRRLLLVIVRRRRRP